MSAHLTVVESTGEIVEFDQAAAERRAQQIETRLAAVGESFTIALTKIREAIEHRDDIALGYRSPSDYVRDRFGKALDGLPVEMRREAVRELADVGMSTRAIAPVLGVSHMSVSRDLEAGVTTVTPGDDDQMPHQSYVCPNCDAHMGIAGGTGTDEDWDTQDYFRSEIERHESGECTPQTPAPTISPGDPVSRDVGSGQTPQREAAPNSGSVTPQGRREGVVDAPRAAVTGIDGKQYTRPTPSAPRRRPLPDAFRDVAYDLGKKAESLHRLVEDDRFPQNANQVALANRGDLLRINDLLQQVINALPIEKKGTSE